MNKKTIFCLVLISSIMMCNCAGNQKPPDYEYKKYLIQPELYSDPPRTIAILPFSNKIEKSKLTVENWKRVVDQKYFDIDDEQKKTEEYLKRMFVRRAFYKHFSVKPYRDRELIAVDQILKKKDIEWAEDMADKDPAELAALLGVDALIYGEITHLNRIYLGLYSEVSVGCNLKMIDVRNGRTLWLTRDVEKSRAGGASLSLTGIVSSVLNASLNMRKIWVYRVADDLFRRVVEYLPDLEVAVEPHLMVTQEKAGLYSSPGMLGSVGKKIKKLSASTPLTIIGEADQWYHVRTESGLEGWIEPDNTVFSGQELGRPFDVESGPEDLETPTNEELGGLYDLQGMELFKQQKFDAALESLQKAVRYDLDNDSIHFHLAWAYKMNSGLDPDQKLKAVIEHLEKAVQLSPDNVMYFYNLGLAYSEADQQDKAVTAWKKCLEMDPGLVNVRDLLEISTEELPVSE